MAVAVRTLGLFGPNCGCRLHAEDAIENLPSGREWGMGYY